MGNAISQISTGLIQRISASHAPKKLSEGQALQQINQVARFDTVELSNEGILKSTSLNIPSEMKMDKPRAWSIATQTLESRISHVESSLKKADSLNLSFGDRLNFLKSEGMSWAENVKQSDPEMFVEWLKMNKENIEAGRPDRASLPTAFMMKDYNEYVKEPFSALV